MPRFQFSLEALLRAYILGGFVLVPLPVEMAWLALEPIAGLAAPHQALLLQQRIGIILAWHAFAAIGLAGLLVVIPLCRLRRRMTSK